MNFRTLVFLILTLAVLGGLALFNQKKKDAELSAPGPSTETLLPLDRLNDISRFTVSVGTQTMTIARSDTRWIVESLWNYPASFDIVVDNLRKLADVKCGEIVVGGAEKLEEFGLALTTNANLLPPALLTFYDDGGKPLRKITMGSPRMPKATGGRPQFPESAYVQLDDRDVRLIAAYIPGFPRSNDGWIDRSVVSLPAEDMDEISVSLTNGGSYRLTRKVDGTFSSDSLKENESIHEEGVSALASSLTRLNLSTIADPATPAETSGMDQPSIFRARTRDGLVYEVKVGRPVPNLYGRYARIAVTYEKPAPPPEPLAPPVTDTNAPAIDLTKAWEEKTTSDASKAEAENRRLEPWTFVLLESDCRTLTSSREQIVSVVTNAPAASAVETNSPAL